MESKPARKRLLEAVEDNDLLLTMKLMHSEKRTDCCSQIVYDTALILASQLGHKDIVQLFLGYGVNINRKDDRCGTALMAAAENGYVDIVKLLVDNGAKVDLKLRNGDTALMLAVQNTQSPQITDYLLSKGANVNVRNREGKTPAFICMEQCDLDNLKVLIDYEADLDVNNFAGTAALKVSSDNNNMNLTDLFLKCKKIQPLPHLFAAIDKNFPGVLKLLLSCSFVDIELERENYTPLTWALMKGYQHNWNPSYVTDSEIIKMIIMYGADVNHVDGSGNIPLCLAATSGRRDLVSLLLIFDADVNSRHTAHNMTALMYAAQNGHLDIIRLLIQYKACLDFVSDNMNSALTFALEKGDVSCATFLLNEGAVINVRHDSHVIAKSNQCESLKLLLEHVDISELSGDILFIAVQESCFKMVKLLIDLGINLKATNISDANILLEADSEEMLELLISKGNLINMRDCGVLVELCSSNANVSVRDKIVELLLQKGANVNIVDAQGATALIQAATYEREESSQLLIDAGSDVNHANHQGHTALMRSAQKGSTLIMKLLIDKGANVNSQNLKGFTALMYAVMNSYADAAQLLLSHGADANLAENNGSTAILMTENEDMVKLLVENGADLNLQDNHGSTPLILATLGRSVNLLKTLIGLGADVNIISSVDRHTALSCVITCEVLRNRDCETIETLVKAGSARNRFHHCDTTIARMIVGNQYELVKLCLITGFLMPSPSCFECLKIYHCVPLDLVPRLAQFMEDNTKISLLQLALIYENIIMARYLVVNSVLVQLDLSKKALSNIYKYLRDTTHGCKSIAFLDNFLSKPLPLAMLSFVAVSDAITFSSGREQRVRATNLPYILQNRLLFKQETEIPIEVCVKDNESLSPRSDWF